jgi:hypothetical protein
MARYLTEDEYLDLRTRGRIKDYRNAHGDVRPLLHIQLPEPGGAFMREPVVIVTEPVPTKLTNYGVRVFDCDPDQWARDHRHPDYFYDEAAQ